MRGWVVKNKSFFFYVQLSTAVISTFIGTLGFSQAQSMYLKVAEREVAPHIPVLSRH